MKYIKKDMWNNFLQFFRFAFVGVLNTAVDFAVLNILIFLFGGSKNTLLYAVFKSVAFIVAVINSYFFNKFWVFRSYDGSKTEGLLFFLISTLGFVLNILVFTIVFSLLIGNAYGREHTQIISNMAALAGTCVVLLFNFIGYKFLVFK